MGMFLWLLLVLALLVAFYFAVQVYIRKVLVERADKYSAASNPGRVKPTWHLLQALSPILYPYTLRWSVHKEMLRVRIFIARQLWQGASNPALVLQENPVIISAYATDCDAVLLLRFLPETIEEMKARGMVLGTGTRLLSINTYFMKGQEHEGDEVVLGPLSSRTWSSFRPYIAQFMCDDSQLATIRRKQAEIPAQMWERTRVLGIEKLRGCDLDGVRWGSPMCVEVPGSYRTAIAYAKHWGMNY